MSNDGTEKKIKGLSNLLDALLLRGLITEDQKDQIQFESTKSGQDYDTIILREKMLDSEVIAKIKAEMRGISFVDLEKVYIPIETLNQLPKKAAEEAQAIVFDSSKSKTKVAMVDPLDLQKVKYIESVLKKPVDAYFAAKVSVDNIIANRYGDEVGADVDLALDNLEDSRTSNAGIDNQALTEESSTNDAPVIRIVNMILEYGVKNIASDIHIEPRESNVVVRFRVRGLLTEKLTLPKKLMSSISTRIKILANLKIDEHRIPQDGRFPIDNSMGSVDVRVSIMPSAYGEKIVLRILEKSKGIMTLDQLGISGVPYSRLKDALKKTQGIIFVTGPTNSGKSQTIASSLKVLNSPEVNIITIEDPIELKIAGVTQVQVNTEVGLNFATGLRSILRQDPDIIMVGEIRDAETAALTVQAALVGRLVLTTIHTNNASSVFIRLMDMGIEPFLLSSTVNLVIAQRLVRTLCECKEPYEADKDSLQKIHEELDELGGINIYSQDKKLKLHFDKDTTSLSIFKPVGCEKCNQTGYIGRTGIFEALKMSEELASKIIKKSSVNDVEDQAKKEGMITMIQDGFLKVLEGETTVEEILRVKNE